MSLHQIHTLLQGKVPGMALPYCTELWNTFQFNLKISKPRVTKLGDYKFDPKTKSHTISVNTNLNPFSFIITYIHEVAHCVNVMKNGRKVQAHGKEWKQQFKTLMLPVLTPDVFPDSILRALSKHLKNPKASTQADYYLLQALRKFDECEPKILLRELKDGDIFKFKNRMFQKIHLRRTKVMCQDIATKRNYLISGIANIEIVDKSGGLIFNASTTNC